MLSGLAYLVPQHRLRTNANNPQMALVQSATAALQNGESPTEVIRSLPATDMGQTSLPYLVVYNVDKSPVAASTNLNGKPPVPPPGVFDYSKNHADDRFTWQPQTNVRCAAIMRYVSGAKPAYILAGRSLKEVERHEGQLALTVLMGWLFAIVASVSVFWLSGNRSPA
jgi:hypothetical protein